MQKLHDVRAWRATRFTPPPKQGLFRAFSDPRYAPWMALRGWAALHSFVGLVLGGAVLWASASLSPDNDLLGWLAGAGVLIGWSLFFRPIRRRAQLLRKRPAVPAPPTMPIFLLAAVLFEVRSFSMLAAPKGWEWVVVIEILINAGVTLWVLTTGLCYFIGRIPFHWPAWLLGVVGMAVCSVVFFLTALNALWRGW